MFFWPLTNESPQMTSRQKKWERKRCHFRFPSSVSLGEALVSTKRMVGTRAAAYALCKVSTHTRTSAERTTTMRQTEIRSDCISKPNLSDGVITRVRLRLRVRVRVRVRVRA